MKKWSVVLGIVFGLGVFFANQTGVEAIYNIPAPTIVGIGSSAQVTETKPLITGVTFNDTVVDVYIDGVFNGKAAVANDDSGVASFGYTPFLRLTPGKHTVFTVARSLDETVRSQESEHQLFEIGESRSLVPAPVLIDPIVADTGIATIAGNIKNDLEVEVYIEGVLQASFTPPTSKTGTTNFWFKKYIAPGEYTVTVRARDVSGNTSIVSQEKVVFVPDKGQAPTKTTPAPVEKEDKEPIVADDLQGDDIGLEDVQDIEDHLGDEPVIVDAPVDTTVIIEKDTDSGAIIIDATKDEATIVVADEAFESEPVDKITFENTAIDDVMIEEKEAAQESVLDDATIDEGVEEVVVEEVTTVTSQDELDDEVQERNRLTGFIILLVIAVALAIWYVHEKRQIAKAEAAAKDASGDDEGN